MKIEYRDGKAFVTMDTAELLHAATVGVMRRVQAVKRKSRNKKHPNTTRLGVWTVTIESAGSEKALAYMLGWYWHALVSDPKSLPGDAGNAEAKWSDEHHHRLLINEHDAVYKRYYLVTGWMTDLIIHGSMTGVQLHEGPLRHELCGKPLDPPCWVGEQKQLRKIVRNEVELLLEEELHP